MDLNINTVVVCGVNTEVCVSQTARELADRGYDVLLEDGCATLSMYVHRSTLDMFGMVFGQLRSSDEIIGGLKTAT
jgi:nicotinamidase-related amidase